MRSDRSSLQPPLTSFLTLELEPCAPGSLGQLGRRRVSPGLEFLAEFRRPATNRDERLSSLVVDELGVDVLQAPEDGEARTRGRSPHALPDPEMPDLPSLDLDARQHGRLYFGVAAAAPAFLPTFRRMTSSAHFTPLPL